MTIFADKRILSEEIDAFAQSVKSLQSQTILDSQLSETGVLVWYEANKCALGNAMKSHKFEDWLHKVSPALRKLDDVSPIMNAIAQISNADDEYHVSENAYAALIKKYASVKRRRQHA